MFDLVVWPEIRHCIVDQIQDKIKLNSCQSKNVIVSDRIKSDS